MYLVDHSPIEDQDALPREIRIGTSSADVRTHSPVIGKAVRLILDSRIVD